jgi:hypothetical protein
MPRFYRFTIALACIGSAAIIAYWAIWFAGDRSWLASLDTPSYYAFENAFPAADAWLAFASAATAWTLYKRRPSAVLWLLVSGSSSVYLGLMDILFDLENNVYRAPDVGAVITEIVINLSSLAIGVWMMWFGWHHRSALLARSDR